MQSIERQVARLEARIGAGDGRCHCPERDRYVAGGHVDSRDVLWHTNPDTCPDCGGSTVDERNGGRLIIIRMDTAAADKPLEELPFGGYDRWGMWGPPAGRQEEIIPTGIADAVERTRDGKLVFVPITELMES